MGGFLLADVTQHLFVKRFNLGAGSSQDHQFAASEVLSLVLGLKHLSRGVEHSTRQKMSVIILLCNSLIVGLPVTLICH